jgi:uncharacterized protein (DUF1697 family)
MSLRPPSSPRLIAFLRAINVGGHTVTMEVLRGHFEALGFASVETLIASGNVIFTSRAGDVRGLERKIERRLEDALGYEVATFIRTDAEVIAVSRHRPFTAARRQASAALNVGFLAEPLTAAGRKALMTFKTGIDDFHVHGREVYWLCARKQSESTFSNVRFEKTLGVRATFRGINTIQRLVERLNHGGRGGPSGKPQ